MNRSELDALLRHWTHERALPPGNPRELADVLLDALAEHWELTPEAVRNAVLAVAAALRRSY